MLEPTLFTNEAFNSSFQWPICCEYFGIPIYQCDNGHSICFTCWEKNTVARCPIWRDRIGRSLRNFHLEQQVQSIDYICKHVGCNVRIKLSKRFEHEQECAFNPNLQCILQNCKWFGDKNILVSHMNAKHKIPHYDISGRKAEFSSRLRPLSLQPAAGWVKLLHTFSLSQGQKTTILTYIFMDSSKNLFYPQFRVFGNKELPYKIKIWNIERENAGFLSTRGIARTFKIGLEEEREQKLCLAFDLESLVNHYAFFDKTEDEHKLLHYKLKIG